MRLIFPLAIGDDGSPPGRRDGKAQGDLLSVESLGEDAPALLLCLMLLLTLIEVVGVGSVFPLLQILSTPEKFTQGAMAAYFKSIGLTSTKEIALLLIAVFAIFLVLSNLLSIFVLSESTKFAWTNWRNVATRSFGHYLLQPYEFFLSRHSAHLTKVVMTDSLYVGTGILLPLLQVTAKLLVIVALGLTLIAFEPVTTLLLLAFFIFAYGAFSLYSHKAVRKCASISQQGRTQSTRVVAEALRGIKEVTNGRLLYVGRGETLSQYDARPVSLSRSR